MKPLRIAICSGMLALIGLAGTTATGYAQPDRRTRDNDDRRDDRRNDSRDQERAYPNQNRSRREVREWQRQRAWARQDGTWQGNRDWDQHRARQFETQHRTWTQRGGYGGAYIPQNRFQANFGSQHAFRLRTRPMVVNGYPRFRYGGYQFMMVDPWPERWADDWYATDDVYVDYDDGYYLQNRREPGFRIALSVVL